MRNRLLTFFIAVFLFSLLCVSCTSEADMEDGLFEQVVSQSASSSYRIRQYLGNTTETNGTSTKDCYFFIEESGLYKNGKRLVSGNFSSGYMIGTDTYLLNVNDNKIYKYDTSGISAGKPFGNRTFNVITDSGFAIEITGKTGSRVKHGKILDLETGNEIDTGNIMDKYAFTLSSGDSILVECYKDAGEIAGNSYYLYSRGNAGSGFIKVEGLTGILLGGFQKVDDTTYYVFCTRDDDTQYNSINRLTVSGSVVNSRKIRSSVNYLEQDGYQNPSCCYDEKDGNKTVLFRSSARYELVKNATADTPFYNETYTGFASGIYVSDMKLMNIKEKTGKPGTFIFAFYEYGLFEVTPSTGNTVHIR